MVLAGTAAPLHAQHVLVSEIWHLLWQQVCKKMYLRKAVVLSALTRSSEAP